MNTTLLFAIGAFILGFIIAWIIARSRSGGAMGELESRVHSAQLAADGAKRDFTNLQSELNVKQSHINTLNSNIGILEEKLRLAERGGADSSATIARLQSELQAATSDRPAFEAELRQRDAELNDVRAQLAASQVEMQDLRTQLDTATTAQTDMTDLQARLDAALAEKAQLEADLAARVEASELAAAESNIAAEMDAYTTDAMEAAVLEDEDVADAESDVEVAETATLTRTPDEDVEALKASHEQAISEAQKEIFSLRDGIATLAFAGAELAAAYEKKNKENEELLARMSNTRERQSTADVPAVESAEAPTPTETTMIDDAEASYSLHQKDSGTVGAMGLVADRTTWAGTISPQEGTSDEEPQTALTAMGEAQARLVGVDRVEREDAQPRLAALEAEVESLNASNADLKMQVQARMEELETLKKQYAALQADLQTATEGKADLVAQLQARDAELGNASTAKSDLEAKLQASDNELGSLRKQMAEVQADLDELSSLTLGDGDQGKGASMQLSSDKPSDNLASKVALVKSNFGNLNMAKADVEARLHTRDADLAKLNADIAAQIQAKDDDIADLTVRLDAAKTLLQKRDADFGELQMKFDDLAAANSKFATLQQQLDEAVAARTNLESTLQAREAELDKLTDDLQIGDAPSATQSDESAPQTTLMARMGGDSAPSIEAKPLDRFGLVQSRFAKLSSERTDLETQLKAKDTAFADLQGEFARSKDESEKSLAEKIAEIGTLTAGAATAAASIKEKDDALNAANARLAELQQQLDDTTAARASFDTTLQEKDVALSDASNRLAAFQQQVDEYTTAKTGYETSLQEKDKSLTDLQSQLGDLRANLEGLTAEKTNLETSLNSRNAEFDALNAKMSSLRSELDSTLSAKAQLEDSLKQRETEVSDLHAEVERVKSEGDKSVAARVAEIGVLTAGAAAAAASIKEKDDALSAANAKLAELQHQLDDTAAAHTNLEATLRDRDASLNDANARLTTFEQQTNDLSAAKADLETNWNNRVAEFDALNAQMGNLRSELDGAQSARSQLEDNLKQREIEMNDLRAQLDRARSEGETSVADKVAEIGVLTAGAAAAAAAIKSKDDALHEAQGRISSLEAQINELTTSKANSEGEVADLRAQLTWLEDRLNAAVAERDAAQSQVAQFAARGDAPAAEATTGVVEGEVLAQISEPPEEPAEPVEAETTTMAAETPIVVPVDATPTDTTTEDVVDAQVEDAQVDVVDAEIVDAAVDAPADEGRMSLANLGDNLSDTKAAAVQAASESGVEVKMSPCPQDLSEARGIGSVFEQRLYGAGVGTFWELANLSDDDFKRILNLNERQLLRLDFNDIRADALRLAQNTDAVGRVWEGTEPDNFEPLGGIGEVYERRLYNAGICTYEALANTSVERLMQLCPPTKIRRPEYEQWIERAKRFAQQKNS